MKKGWEIKRLGDVCEIIKGRKPVLRSTPTNGDLPYLIAKVMRGSQEAEYASIEDRNSIHVSESETIIICDGSNSGEVFTGFKGILSSTMGKIAKKVEIEDEYLRAFLASTFDVFNGAKTGAAIPHLDKEAMYALEIPLPPLSVQRRIVRILDEAFDGIATAKANAEKNLQNARALSDSYLQAVFASRGRDWKYQTFGEMAEFRNGVNFTKSSRGETIPILGVRNFQNHFWAPLDALDSVTVQGEFSEADALKENDLVFVRSNGNVELIGRCVLVGPVKERIAHSGFTIRARLQGQGLFPKYICHFLKSSVARRKMIDSGIGTNIKSLSQGVLANLVIPVPSIDEQRKIVERLEQFGNEGRHLESIYQRKLAALDELKQSLLHQAFSGAL
jgi:type I restriction enzyme S subunit